MCTERDSNPHASRRQFLKPTCLPIPSSAQIDIYFEVCYKETAEWTDQRVRTYVPRDLSSWKFSSVCARSTDRRNSAVRWWVFPRTGATDGFDLAFLGKLGLLFYFFAIPSNSAAALTTCPQSKLPFFSEGRPGNGKVAD